MPVGSPRYWSWRFATAEIRAPLLGVYALMAEWRALLDPSTERAVADLKLTWWAEEMQRLTQGSAVHPISKYLASLPRAAASDFEPLVHAVQAASLEVAGAPLERTADLAPHAEALIAKPLLIAARLAYADADESAVLDAARAFAVAEYLSQSLLGYRHALRFGRISFAIDELLAQGIENADLASVAAPPRLRAYLERMGTRARAAFDEVADALPPAQRGRHRHLLILAALGRVHSTVDGAGAKPRHLRDMWLAWRTARRATAGVRH